MQRVPIPVPPLGSRRRPCPRRRPTVHSRHRRAGLGQHVRAGDQRGLRRRRQLRRAVHQRLHRAAEHHRLPGPAGRPERAVPLRHRYDVRGHRAERHRPGERQVPGGRGRRRHALGRPAHARRDRHAGDVGQRRRRLPVVEGHRRAGERPVGRRPGRLRQHRDRLRGHRPRARPDQHHLRHPPGRRDGHRQQRRRLHRGRPQAGELLDRHRRRPRATRSRRPSRRSRATAPPARSTSSR